MNASVQHVGRVTPRITRTDRVEHWFAKTFNFGGKGRVRFYRKMERFTKNSFAHVKALQLMWTRYHRDGDTRRAVLRRVIDAMGDGMKFNQAIAPYIPPIERLIIAAGEQRGREAEGFQQCIFVAEASNRMRRALTSQLFYPVVLGLLLALMLWMVADQFVPAMLDMLPLAEWPAIARALYGLSVAVQSYGVATVVVIGVVTILILASLPRWTGPLRRFADRWLAPYVVYREYQGSTFLIALGSLVAAGRPVEATLEQFSLMATPWLKAHLEKMRAALNAGERPGRALRTGLLYRETEGDIEDYDAANSFDSALAAMGTETIEDGIERITSAAGVLRILMMFLAAGLLLFIYASAIFLVLTVKERTKFA